LCAVWAFGSADLVNPEFLYHMDIWALEFEALGGLINTAAVRPNIVILVIMLLVIFFEALDVVWAGLKAGRQ